MKLEAINNRGRKKDFWDIHLLLEHFTLSELITSYQLRKPWDDDVQLLLNRLTYFRDIEDDFDPVCLLGKDWDIIKLDLIDVVKDFKG